MRAGGWLKVASEMHCQARLLLPPALRDRLSHIHVADQLNDPAGDVQHGQDSGVELKHFATRKRLLISRGGGPTEGDSEARPGGESGGCGCNVCGAKGGC